MKRKLLLLFLFVSVFSFGQFNKNAPWMKDLEKKKTQIAFSKGATAKPTYTFKEITDAFDAYWVDKDKDAKGSGYKPFMRWRNYWKHFVKADGTLPTASELWSSWDNFNNSAGPVNPTSDWSIVGPVINNESAIGNPGIGRINAIAVDPNNADVWYAGAPAGGIWKSTDGGASWTPLFDEFPQIGVSGIAIDPNDSNTIYIATGDDDASDSFSAGVFKSTDGGTTWAATGLGPDTQNEFDTMNEIVVDPSNSNRIWVGTTDGLQRSEDAGATWTVQLSGDITDFKLKPGDPNTIYAVDSNSYFRSTDGGATFTEIASTLPTNGGRMVIGVTPADPNRVYICVADVIGRSSAFLGLFESTDSGANFTQTAETDDIFGSTQAWFDFAIAVSPTDPEEIHVGVLDVWSSTNGGDNFTKVSDWRINNASYTHADIHTLKYFNNRLYCGSDGGLFVSNDGVNYTDFSDGLAVTQFYRISIAKNDASRIVGGTQDNSGFVYNNNEWNVYTGGDGMDYEIDPTNGNIAYGFVQFGDPLFITNDLGQSVGAISSPDTGSGNISGNWITPLAIDGEGTVYAAYSSVFKLVGGEWEQVSDFFAQGNNIDDLEIDPNNPMIMYAADQGNLYRSENGGVDFVQINDAAEPFDTQISDIAINDNNSNIVYLTTSRRVGVSQGSQPTERGVYRVTVDGNTLVSRENITFDLPSEQAIFCVVHQPRAANNPIFVGTNLGVYRLDDTLTEWEQYSTNFPNTAVSDLEISPDDGYIVASTYGRGAWQSPIPVEAPSDDVRLNDLQIGDQLFACGEVVPTLTVENRGANVITQIDVVYSVNDGTPENFTYNTNLASGAIESFQIPAIAATIGEQSQISVEVSVTNDAFADNNSLQSNAYIANRAGTAGDVFDFETQETSLFSYNTAGLIPLTPGGVWEIGVPAGTLLNTAASGTQVIGTNLDGNHPDQTTGVIYSGCYDLSTILAPTLSFEMAFDLEQNWDIVYVVYSTDNGDSYNILGQLGSQPNWYNSNRTRETAGNDCFNCPGAQWTGTEATMTKYSYDFVANAAQGETDLTNETNIQFAIVFVADQSVNQEGVIIDDFTIEGLIDDEDDDNDGIDDVDDNCPLIANADQADNDMDGLGDVCDDDDDNDGIPDAEDNCPFTANADQADGDGDGIGDVCDDDLDNDGVPNADDLCADTPANAVVDVDGCEIFSLPANNFSLKTTGESCISNDNGSVEVTAATALNYTATLTDSDSNSSSAMFMDTTTFADLAAGNYTLCLTVDGQAGYELCFDVVITEPEALDVDSKVSSLKSEVTLSLKGGKQYWIDLNGEQFFTTENEITLPLGKVENLLSVRTDKDCQGTYAETIVLSNRIFIYPNPTTDGELNVFLGSNEFESVDMSLYTTTGVRVFGKPYRTDNGYVNMNLSALPPGVYLLNIKTENSLLNYKIVRK
ncbi:thrombospondin type 3 repeat-containing protein [Flagellimonas sp. DF-77]|uniref:thrombospondin type 3 repeat-containing protein n=1 Tax=Flagellimonas algarum TaxID=3230298 RepID=UPI003397FBBB